VIGSLRGRVVSARGSVVLLECGGVGFEIHATPAALALATPGQETTLRTTLAVKEDSLTLYGFANDDEREAFAAVQTVSGIGPRIAMAVLAQMTPTQLAAAVASGDTAALKRVPGIGQKGAQRLVLELAGKLVGVDDVGATAGLPGASGEVVAALVGLGYREDLATEAVRGVASQGAPSSVAELLRAALRTLGGRP